MVGRMVRRSRGRGRCGLDRVTAPEAWFIAPPQSSTSILADRTDPTAARLTMLGRCVDWRFPP